MQHRHSDHRQQVKQLFLVGFTLPDKAENTPVLCILHRQPEDLCPEALIFPEGVIIPLFVHEAGTGGQVVKPPGVGDKVRQGGIQAYRNVSIGVPCCQSRHPGKTGMGTDQYNIDLLHGFSWFLSRQNSWI